MPMSRLHHASCVEFEGIGLLLRGASGSGKSDLALRLIDAGATLVADDQVDLESKGARLIARPPEALAGLLEIRGLGIVALAHATEASISLVVELVSRAEVARLPPAADTALEGVTLPLLRLWPFEPSAVAKLKVAARVASGRLRPVEAALGHGLSRRSA